MSIVAVNPFHFPELPLFTQGFGSSTHSLAATNAKVAWIFECDETDILNSVYLGLGTVTTGCTISYRIETIDTATGTPSGSLVAAGADGTLVIADTDDNIGIECVLTTPPTLTIGNKYAVVVGYSSGATPNMAFGAFNVTTGGTATLYAYPHIHSYNGTTWSLNTSLGAAAISLNWDTGLRYNFNMYMHALSTNTFNNTSNPNYVGNRFQVPLKMRIKGVSTPIDADGPFEIRLYAADGSTLLGTYAITDADLPPTTSVRLYLAYFSTEITLEADTNYYLVVVPTSATNLTTGRATLYNNNASFMNSLPLGSFSDVAYVTAQNPANAAAYAEVAYNFMPFSLLPNGIDSGGTVNLLGGKVR